MITQTCKINMVPGGMPPIIHVSQYDAGSRVLTFELYSGAILWTAPSGATVTIDGTKSDQKAFSVAATVSGSTVTATLTQQMAAAAGRAECQLTVTKGENVLGSANFILDVERAALSEDADISATDISSVETAKTQAISAMQQAQAAAETAQGEAATATKKAQAAADSASAAASSKTAAATSATNAASSASAAAASAETAQTAAETAQGEAATATKKAQAAADSASAAASSKTAAATSATNAASSASAAAASAETAQTAAETAQAAAATVENKADKSHGLWNFTDIPSGADLNDYTACGYYRVSSDSKAKTIANRPCDNSFTLQVSEALGLNDSGAIEGRPYYCRIQKLIAVNGNEYNRYVSASSSGTVEAGAWWKLMTKSDVAGMLAAVTPASIGAMPENAGLWNFTDIPSGADLNDYTACGYYKYSYDEGSFSIQNSPVSAAFTMQVINACGYDDHDAIAGHALKYRLQKLTTWQGDEYVRQAYTDSSGSVTYGAWKTILNNGALGITSGSWTPTVFGAASYTIQTGRYIKIGDMAVVTFSVYGTFAGSTTGRIKVSGCPLTPGENITAGGGDLSGYTAASNIVFTGWQCNKNGSFYAMGQETGTTGTSKLGSTAIYQKTSGEFQASGTIAFQVAS